MAAALAGVVALGCTSVAADQEAQDGSAPRVVQPGAPGTPSRELTPEEAAELPAAPEHTDADVAFMQGMIAHHVQALRMTRLVPTRSAREDIPLFAERMDLSQEDEIGLMQRWLEARGEEVPSLLDGHAAHGHDAHGHGDGAGEAVLMPGMLTEEELLALEDADGEAFDRLFLESMIRHHLGALQMVDELWQAGGAQELEIARFAEHVYGDQEIELARMYAMLAELDAGG